VQFNASARFTGHRSGIYALIPGDAPRSFLSAGGDGQVVRWDLDRPDDGELIASVDRPVFALAHDHERQLLLIGKDDGRLHVLDLSTRKERHLFAVHRNGIFSIVALPGGRFACAGGDGSLSIWSSDPVELVRQIPIADEKLRDLSIGGDGNWMAVADGGGMIHLLETVDLNEHHRVNAHDGGSTAVIFHPGKPAVLSGGKDGHLRTWGIDGLRPIHAFPAHAGTIYRIRFDPTGTICSTAGRDKTVKLWDAATLDPQGRFDRSSNGHARSVNALLWIDGTLISAGDDGRIIAWGRRG
jgi:WD40 repeat protein